VIGAALPVANVSPYSVARRLATLPTALTAPFLQVLLPLASRLDAEGDVGSLRDLYLAGTRLALALFAVVGGALIVYARPFLQAWAPQAISSADIVVLLTAAATLEAVMAPVSQALQGMNRHRPLVVFSLGSAALNLGLSIALVGPLGVKGVALGTVIATSIEASIVLPFGARLLAVRLADLRRRVIVPAVLPIVPMAAVLLLIRSQLAPASIPAIGLASAAGVLVYGACYLALPGTEGERALVRRALVLGRRALTR
jgi:O-antigen/teichoic acid export membrane protein